MLLLLVDAPNRLTEKAVETLLKSAEQKINTCLMEFISAMLVYKCGGAFGNSFSQRGMVVGGGGLQGLHSRTKANLSVRFRHRARKLGRLSHWIYPKIKDNIYAHAHPASDLPCFSVSLRWRPG